MEKQSIRTPEYQSYEGFPKFWREQQNVPGDIDRPELQNTGTKTGDEYKHAPNNPCSQKKV